MPEITLRDLCRWDRRLTLLPPADVAADAALDRGVSWAVAVRATPPLLPPLRGDELVILPLRVLAEIESTETLSREELLATLSRERIAAILTEPGFTEEPLDHLPVLMLPSPFPHDAEQTLNRLITERRAELYRLGTELTRRLSQAAVDPRGVEALLASAAALGARPLVLQDADGNVVAWGGSEVIAPAGLPAMAEARQGGGPRQVPEADGVERLIVALPPVGRAGYLSTVGPAGTLSEVDRLVLTQTAGTCAAVLARGQGGPAARAGRSQLVADLLLGRVPSEAAAKSRAQTLGLDPAAPVVVGLIAGAADLPVAREVVAQALGRPAAELVAPLPEGAGFLATTRDAAAVADAVGRALERGAPAGEAVVVVSEAVQSPVRAADGLRQARFALALRRAGALEGRVICCARAVDLGLFRLLFPLWGTPALQEFRRELLGAIEDYDADRGTDLVETLAAYLSLGGALNEAAERLGVHRNTLAYRLQRIRELTGRDLADPRERLLLQVALLIRRMPPFDLNPAPPAAD